MRLSGYQPGTEIHWLDITYQSIDEHADAVNAGDLELADKIQRETLEWGVEITRNDDGSYTFRKVSDDE